MVLTPPVVLVHEFITGGGWPGETLPMDLAAEGRAMLQAVLADFRAWDAVHTVTTLDYRLDGTQLPADRIITLRPEEEYEQSLFRLVTKSDAALIIAPESSGILARLSALVERAGIPLLGAGSAAVAIAADKWACYRRFVQAALPTPPTWLVSSTDAPAVAKRVGFPLVIKPVDGVGCEGVGLVTDVPSLGLALEHSTFEGNGFLLQRYVAGTHASVSLLVTAQGTQPLSLNGQMIAVGERFVYRGGIVPLQHPQRARAVDVARQAVSLIPGLRGYVGVDLVLTDAESYLIEVNPRLTTSYVGLRQVINFNLAEAIWLACQKNVLPPKVTLTGQVSFRKEKFKEKLNGSS